MLHDNLEAIRSLTENSQNWVVQKYIENPLILNNRKFDIRQWVLVTNADPLTVYIYEDSYLRFSAEEWDIADLANPYVHLTNNSIAKKSKLFDRSESMCHVAEFRAYLQETHGRNLWDESIFPRIKQIVRWSLQSIGRIGYRKGKNFELFGYDFMVDANLQPWLLEVNSSPSMEYSTPVTETLVRQVLTDCVKIVVDESTLDTGRFTLIYKGNVRFKSY